MQLHGEESNYFVLKKVLTSIKRSSNKGKSSSHLIPVLKQFKSDKEKEYEKDVRCREAIQAYKSGDTKAYYAFLKEEYGIDLGDD